MEFAMKHQGNYSDSLSSSVCPFYCSYSGYKNIIKSLGGGDQPDIFSWDSKYAGAYVLLSQQALVNNDNNFEQYKQEAESFICKILPNTPSSSTHYPQGGLMYKLPQSNLQHVTAITFLLTTYAKYMKATQHSFDCGNSVTVVPDALISLSKQQVDYILGDNPIKMSYMVRFGPSFLMRIHHRASSLPSRGLLSKPFNCIEGFQFYHTENPNPNLLAGAIVGGPDENDAYPDKRDEYIHSEPATYINAAFVGPLAYFGSGGSA
ncbi:hypothetical protein Bca101_027565 [Brassica carinata]